MGRRLSRLPLTAASLLNGSYQAATKGQIYVEKLHWSITPGALFNYFGRYGKVESVHIPYNLKTGLSRGFGWVLMSNKETVSTALAQSNHFIGDFNITVVSRRSNAREMPREQQTSHTAGVSDTLASLSGPPPDSHSGLSHDTESSVDPGLPKDVASTSRQDSDSKQAQEDDIMGSSVEPPVDDAVDELLEYVEFYDGDKADKDSPVDLVKGTGQDTTDNSPQDADSSVDPPEANNTPSQHLP